MRSSRKPEIMADAAYWILTQPSRQCTGNFFIDDEVLINKVGMAPAELDKYAYCPGHPLAVDFFLESESLTNEPTTTFSPKVFKSKL